MRSRIETAVAVGLVLLMVGTLVMLLWPAVNSRPRSREVTWRMQLRNVGIALHSYHCAYGCFPPAVVVDEATGHRHSWRLLLLPYLDHYAEFRQYRFDQPWNSPENLKLQDVSHFTAVCEERGRENHWTSVTAVVGDRTMWRESGSRTLDDVADGADRTILVVGVMASGIHWMEPKDLHFETMSFHIGSGPSAIGGCDDRGAQVVFVDGGVHSLDLQTDEATVRSLLTVDDGRPE